MSISTHVLDAVSGRPAVGLAVGLEALADAGWITVGRWHTDGDGRIPALREQPAPAGDYRLTFDTGGYLERTFYPQVVIVFRVSSAQEHHHVPLLLSPYAYSTYRGS